MNVNELMIGDWVTWPIGGKDTIMHVTGVYNSNVFLDFEGNEKYDVEANENVKPIRITEELLEDNGMEMDEDENYTEYMTPFRFISMTKCEDGYFSLKIENNSMNVDVYVKYVHELQHALRLCGVEKEIVL